MPLRFRSLSHGDIAFGFFNVESDMLLLENMFFFADDFCGKVAALENACAATLSLNWNVWHIANRSQMGDYRNFLGEQRDGGFWGDLYRRYPFPETPDQFHQKPEGWKTQSEVIGIIGNYAVQKEIAFGIDPDNAFARIGAYCFSYPAFKELIRYVWLGGYPRWLNGQRPQYVLDMKEKIAQSEQPFFKGINFSMTQA